MQDLRIYLGPLLGVDSDEDYSICILVKSMDEQIVMKIELVFQGEPISTSRYVQIIDGFYFLKFEFKSRNETEERIKRSYLFRYNGSQLFNVNGNEFTFYESPVSKVPVVGFVSCNGTEKSYPDPSDCNLYSGWKHISNKLDKDYQMDYLFLTGDQIYADSIYSKIEELKSYQVKSESLTESLMKQIDLFYLYLYIDSWGNKFVAQALASIPNIMVWDDHDIIDGFGSLNDSHCNPVLTELFLVALRYYRIFQRRICDATDLAKPNLLDCSYLMLRNYLFVYPETRAHRSPCQVMTDVQYSQLRALVHDINIVAWTHKAKLTYSWFAICCIIPVPLAHIDYTSKFERFIFWLEKIKKNKFAVKEALDDDLLDHWDHKSHRKEQILLLDVLFEMASRLDPKNLIIVSGDVHSNGAATITKSIGNRTFSATQLVCSPIVNEPYSRSLNNILSFLGITRDFDRFIDYKLDLKNFGNSNLTNISKRAFMYITSGRGFLKAKLVVERKNKWELMNSPRSINNFK